MNDIVNHITQPKQTHHYTRVYVDGTNHEVIRELKDRIDEYQESRLY